MLLTGSLANVLLTHSFVRAYFYGLLDNETPTRNIVQLGRAAIIMETNASYYYKGDRETDTRVQETDQTTTTKYTMVTTIPEKYSAEPTYKECFLMLGTSHFEKI